MPFCVFRGVLFKGLGATVAAEEIAAAFVISIHVILGCGRDVYDATAHGAFKGCGGLLFRGGESGDGDHDGKGGDECSFHVLISNVVVSAKSALICTVRTR